MRTSLSIWLLSLALCFGNPFMDASRWRGNVEDGGEPPKLTVVDGSLRFEYLLGEKGWGNMAFDSFTFDGDCTGIEFDVFVEDASSGSTMHLWLFERDGDGWVQRIVFDDDKLLSSVKGQWRHVSVPFSNMRHQPRGDKKPAFMTIHQMLLGFNFASQTVRVRNIQLNGGGVLKQDCVRTLADDWKHPGKVGSRIGIFHEPDLHDKGAAARVERLQALLKTAGFETVVMRAGDLENEKVLSASKLDLLILARGDVFPAGAVTPFKRYLKDGGHLLSLGGYPLDNLKTFTGQGWLKLGNEIPAKDIGKNRTETRLNTRYGRQGDAMNFEAGQIGLCDPSYLLRNVSGVRVATEQAWVTDDVKYECVLEGPAAIALTGVGGPVFPRSQSRFIPLLESHDAYGRNRGAVASVVLNYSGEYRGSNWGMVTPSNVDFLDGRYPGVEGVVVLMCRKLLGCSYLIETDVDLPSARVGEKVVLKSRLYSAVEKGLEVRYYVDGVQVGAAQPALQVGKLCRGGEVSWTIPDDGKSYHEVSVELWGEGKLLDKMSNGIVVRRDEVMKKGVSISLEDNYFKLNGKKTFFGGANTTGIMWHSKLENPRVWRKDFEAMGDYGMNTLRILHFSPFCKLPGQFKHTSKELAGRPLRTQSQTDAIVQLAQEHQVTVFLSLHDWLPMDLSDEELAHQVDWNRYWVSRYAEVPGVFYDIQNEPTTRLRNVAVLKPMFEAFLRERYGSLEAAFGAWKASGSPGEIDFRAKGTSWQDLRARDTEQFRWMVFERWVKANMGGIKAGNPQALGTVGYLSSLNASEKHLATQYQDFANLHHYGELSHMRSVVKLMDRRWCGRSMTLGEFGSRTAHSARNSGVWGDPSEESIKHYMSVGHCVLGMGGAFTACWSWKDFQECVFPWGINHSDLTAKPVLEAYRNMSLMFRQVRPRYEAPSVYVVVPDGYRFGFRHTAIHEGMRKSVDALLQLNVPFSVISEWTLDALPKEAKTLIWPMAYGAKDETFAKIESFVKAGGTLLVTGDPRFGYSRQADRLDRLSRLGLNPSWAPLEPGKDGSGVRTLLSQDGCVLWHGTSLEEFGDIEEDLVPLYRRFLDEVASAWRIKLLNEDGKVLAFELPLDDGVAGIVVNMSAEDRVVTLPAGKQLPGWRMGVAKGRTAFVQLGKDGRVLAFSCQGDMVLGDRTVCKGNQDVGVVSLNGEDVATASVALLPFNSGANVTYSEAASTMETELGEFRGGAWRRLGDDTDSSHAALDIRLRAPSGKMSAAREALGRLLYLKW